VNIQQMGSYKGETSGSGVAFSRDESPGNPNHRRLTDQRAGEMSSPACRKRWTSRRCASLLPTLHKAFEILRTLERHYGDMQDTEFTVEEGASVHAADAQRQASAQAAVRFAVDAVSEGLLTKSRRC